MFDGPTTAQVDWDGPLVTIDLSAVATTPALPILMACATAWLHTLIARPDSSRQYLVLDEAWRFLHHIGTARWLQASLKLARQYQLANILVIHRQSDLDTAGNTGSELTAIAHGLLNDTETRIDYDQAASPSTGARRGQALWTIGKTRHLVQHELLDSEADIVDTG
jgi:hypothetical protein